MQKSPSFSHVDDQTVASGNDAWEKPTIERPQNNLPRYEDTMHKEEAYSPELADALAKQNNSFWTKSTMKLVPVLIVGFLSRSHQTERFIQSCKILTNLRRLLHEWV